MNEKDLPEFLRQMRDLIEHNIKRADEEIRKGNLALARPCLQSITSAVEFIDEVIKDMPDLTAKNQKKAKELLDLRLKKLFASVGNGVLSKSNKK